MVLTLGALLMLLDCEGTFIIFQIIHNSHILVFFSWNDTAQDWTTLFTQDHNFCFASGLWEIPFPYYGWNVSPQIHLLKT